MNRSGLKASVLHGLLWMSWGKVARAVLQIGIIAVLARLITPRDFGVVSAAFIFIEFTAIFAQIGLGKALVQQPALRPEHIATAFYGSVALGLVLTSLTWVFAAPIAALFRMPMLIPVLKVLSVTFVLRSIGIAAESQLQREMRFRWLANRELAGYTFGYGLIGVSLACVGWGVWALVFAHLAQTAMNTVLLLVAKPIRLRVAPDIQALRELGYFSGGYTIGRIANQLAAKGDSFVVGRCLGSEALGVYGRAFQLMAAPADIFGDIVDNVLFPAMARTQEDTERLSTAYRRGTSLIALLMLPLSMTFCLLAPHVVNVLLGPGWGAAVVPFELLALGLVFRTGCRMSDALTRAGGFVYQRAWRQILFAAGVIGGAWLLRPWGVAGVALGVLVALCGNYFLMAQISLKVAHMRWKSFFEAQIPAVLLATVVAAMVYVTSKLLFQWFSSSIAVLLAVLVLGLCVLISIVLWRPLFLIGDDGLWMLDTLRDHLAALRRTTFSSLSETKMDVAAN